MSKFIRIETKTRRGEKVMKKLVVCALCAALVVPTLAVSVQADASKELVLYTWENMFPQEVLDGFEEETGIKIVYSNFDTDENMLEKLSMAKGGDYDVVVADPWQNPRFLLICPFLHNTPVQWHSHDNNCCYSGQSRRLSYSNRMRQNNLPASHNSLPADNIHYSGYPSDPLSCDFQGSLT